jgi:hypothetical protein
MGDASWIISMRKVHIALSDLDGIEIMGTGSAWDWLWGPLESITLGSLVDGIEMAAARDRLRVVANDLIFAVDTLAAHIDTARAFANGESRIFAAGKKPRAKAGKSKPNFRWGVVVHGLHGQALRAFDIRT